MLVPSHVAVTRRHNVIGGADSDTLRMLKAMLLMRLVGISQPCHSFGVLVHTP